MIRVLLADDQVLVRSGFRALLESEDDIAVVGEAGDGQEAIEQALATTPDVVLMDIRMPRLDGIAATRQIVENPHLAECRVLILTTFEQDDYVADALDAGASGFLVKHTEPGELLRAVRVVADGEALLSPGATRLLIGRFVRRTAPPGREPHEVPRAVDDLTTREREAIALVAEGLSNDEIADRWVVSTATVRTHVSRAMTKLAARDRAQLVVFAYRYGLATPPDLNT